MAIEIVSYLPAGLSIIWSQSILQNNSCAPFWEGCCYYSSTWLSHSAFRALMTWDTEQPIHWIFLPHPLATIPALFHSGYVHLSSFCPRLFLTNMEAINLLFKKESWNLPFSTCLSKQKLKQQKLAIIEFEIESKENHWGKIKWFWFEYATLSTQTRWIMLFGGGFWIFLIFSLYCKIWLLDQILSLYGEMTQLPG